MKPNKIIFFFLLILGLSTVKAQDISFTASASPVVGVGQQFAVTYTVNKRPSKINPPSFDNFDFLGGPSQSTSNEIQIINGQMQQSTKISFTYYLRGNTKGSFQIDPATCEIDGKTYTSNNLTVKVDEASTSQQNQPQTRAQQQRQAQSSGQDVVSLDEKALYLKVTPNKTNVYQGEEVIMTYRIYTLVPIQFDITKLPTSKGFWVEELTDKNTSIKQFNEVVDGKQYSVAEIRKVALFPQESGALTVPPIEIDVLARVQTGRGRSFFDSFFDDPFFSSGFGGTQTVKKGLKSRPVTINVSKLPAAPDGFTGGVGNFSIKTTVDRNNLKAHEAIKFKATITGSGNLMLIDQLNANFPLGFEIYDPKITSNINKGETGVGGSRTFEWLLIPRAEGEYEIPEIKFVYFNPRTKQYETKTSQSHTIAVAKGDASSATAGVISSHQSEVKLLNTDIEYIKTQPFVLQEKGHSFFRSTIFYILLLIPVVGLFLVLFFWKRIEKKRGNVSMMRLKRATAVAKKRLNKSEKLLKEGNQKAFYEELSQALWGYVSDKFGISLSELSMASVREALSEKQVNQEIIEEIIKILEMCEFARFAPSSNGVQQMDSIYNEALQIIEKIEGQLKVK